MTDTPMTPDREQEIRQQLSDLLYGTYGQQDRHRTNAIVDVVMPVVLAAVRTEDDEVENLRAEVENGNRYIKRLDTEYDGLRAEWAELRSEVDRLRADRAAILREAADAIVAENDRQMWASKPGQHWAADHLRRLADVAAQGSPEPEVTP